MFLTSRFRAAVRRGDEGAVAILVALVSLVLFGVAALAIDIGEMYARRRAAQTDADFAALAGVVELPNQALARLKAYEYLEKNLPSGGPMPPLLAFSDGSMANGEILFPGPHTIRVVVPPRTVKFGLAGAIGFSEAEVSAAATAEARSPAAALPFFVTAAGASGYSCLKDTAPGGGNPSAVRSVLLQPAQRPPQITSTAPATLSDAGGQTLTVTGDNFRNPAPDVTSVKIDGVEVTTWTIVNNRQITLTTPAHPAGPATLTVTNAHGTASATLLYVPAPPLPAPTVTAVTPASGPEAGGTQVTITGTGFTGATAVTFGAVPAVNPTITNATTIVATSPAGTGAVHVRVTTPGGVSAETDADLFTYEVDACAGVTGSFGYLDIPRSTPPLPPNSGGAAAGVMINIAAGIDHAWSSFPPAQLPAPGTQCRSGNTTIPGAVLDDGDGVDGANCVDVQNGNMVSASGTAFLDGYDPPQSDPLDPRMKAPDGHDSVTIHGRSGLDGDSITDYLNVSLTDFTTALATGTATPGWIDPEIVACPRFAIVPVVNVLQNPQNGFYPIKGFAGVFIDGPAPDRGFDANNNGTQIESIRAYAFSLDFLPGIVASGTTEGTVTYLGTGPKVPVLVHDAGDPSY